MNTPSLVSGGSLTVGNTYYWVITATNANGESIASSDVNDYLTPTAALAAPTGGNATTSITGGNLTAGTYYYEITALNAYGETTLPVSDEVNVTTTGTNLRAIP